MEQLGDSYLRRWWIPLACCLAFFAVIAFLIPYSSSLWAVKLTLAGLIRHMCAFGNAAQKDAPFDYTYCLFVPPIFAYLVYLKWDVLKKTPIQGSYLGLAVIALGTFLYWFGLRSENQYFGYISLQILLCGLILWLWGTPVFRLLVFPCAFFVFAWPVPFLDPIIAFPMRLTMSSMASHLLPIIGIPCVQNGTGLLSPADPLHNIALGSRFQIDIADPCSGIRSLFALLMFSALFAHLFVERLWQQWVVFLSAFPLAILGNLVRVILLVIGSILFGSAFAIGTNDEPSWYHEGCGFAVYGVALGTEIFIASLLARQWGKSARLLPDGDRVSG
jgi:exosortase